MHKFPLRATALMSVFLVFFLSLRNPIVKTIDYEFEGMIGSASSNPSLHRYEYEVVNKTTDLQVLHKDRLENPHSSHYEAKDAQDESQNGSQHREERIPHITHSGQKSIRERETQVSVSKENDKGVSQASEYLPPSPTSSTATTTNIGNPLQKTLWRKKTWGSHPLPPRSEFTERPGARWVTFFHDQAVAAVLLSNNGTIFDCIVQEVIEVWEQDKALEYLGEIMPLEPVELPFMVHLSTLCGVLNTPTSATRPAAAGSINLWSQGLSVLQGILPGTLWCGRSDQAVGYRNLGSRAALDSCCRTHDHCPTKLLPMTSRYGLTNLSLKTRSHCLCELEFYRCLKAITQSDPLSTTVGEVYFNILKLDCLSTRPTHPIRVADNASGNTAPHTNSQEEQIPPQKSTSPTLHPGPRMECSRQDSNGGCRRWLLNSRGSPTLYYFTPSNLTF